MPTLTPWHEGLEVNLQHEGLQHKSYLHDDLQYKEAVPEQLSSRLPTLQSQPRGRNPLGLGPMAFGVLVALITVIVVGAIVGGGVGGALSSSQHSYSDQTILTSTVTTSPAPTSSTATPNLDNYAPESPQSVTTLQWNCPGMTTYTTGHLNPNQDFAVTCGVDYGHGTAANEGGVVADIIGIVAYTAVDCMEACANLNGFVPTWNYTIKCAGITFSQQLSMVYGDYGANCWLKNGTTVNPFPSSNELSASVLT